MTNPSTHFTTHLNQCHTSSSYPSQNHFRSNTIPLLSHVSIPSTHSPIPSRYHFPSSSSSISRNITTHQTNFSINTTPHHGNYPTTQRSTIDLISVPPLLLNSTPDDVNNDISHSCIQDIDPNAAIIHVHYIPIAACIALFSFIGVFLRILVSGLFLTPITSSSSSLFPIVNVSSSSSSSSSPVILFGNVTITLSALAQLLFPQLLGCLIMGWIVQGRDYLSQIYLPLYLGITTGLCGSLTSFSTIISLSVGPLISTPHAWRSGFHYLFCILLVIIAFSLSQSSYCIGKRIGSIIPGMGFLIAHHEFNNPLIMGSPIVFIKPSSRDQLFIILFIIVWLIILSGCIIIPLTVSYTDPWFSLLLSLVMAPVGSLLRYIFSVSIRTPGGTLLSNWLAVVIVIILRNFAFYLGVTSDSPLDIIVNVIIIGFTGSLSTVSSFIFELNNMCPRQATIYWIVTVFPALIVAFLGLGLPIILR